MANQGGRYVVDDNGNKTLVERTGWQPPARAKAKPKTTPAPVPESDTATEEVTNHVVS